MSTRRSVALVLVAGLLTAGSACSSSGGKTPDKAGYVTQGNAICAAGNARLQAVGKTIDTNNRAAVDQAVKDKVVPDIRGQIKDLRALGYPKGDKDKLSAIYDKVEAELDIWAKDPSKSNGSTVMSAANKELTAYGLSECGK
ncbi:MAG: hypothetical protein JWN46_1487 [Acidimicrobiales bacterium]|nr:hypothetical protein [Acidimicrobiales bacterium]